MALTKVTGSVIKDSVSLSGNVSVGGTLTYQDVTNVDALGIGTFRTGIKVLAGQVDVGSNIKLGNAGVVTATSFVGSSGLNVLDGRVKIGTTSNTPAAANEPGIVFGDNTAGTATKGIASFCANGAAPLLLTRRVSDGNVLGIADDAGTKGLLRVTSNDLVITAIEELRFSTGAGHVERMRLTNAGRLGIGLGGPSSALHVKSSSGTQAVFESTGSDNASIQFQDSTTTDSIIVGALNNDLQIRCDPGNIVFKVANNTEKVRITSTGNVGISSVTPSSPLEIHTNASAAWKFRINTSVSDGAGFYQRSNGDFELVLRDASNNNNYIVGSGGELHFVTSGSERLRIKANGDVQIGTSVSAGDALRYFDVANFNTGSSAGAILRLLTTKSDGSSSAGLDIVKYKAGGAYLVNYETVGADTGFIALSTGQNGASPAVRFRVAGNGETVITPTNGGASNNRTSIHFNNAAHSPFISFKSNNVTEASYILCSENTGGAHLNIRTKRKTGAQNAGSLLSVIDFGSAGEIRTYNAGGSQLTYPLVTGASIGSSGAEYGQFNYDDMRSPEGGLGGWVNIGIDYNPSHPYPRRAYKIAQHENGRNGTRVYHLWHDGDANYHYGGMWEIRLNEWGSTSNKFESVHFRCINGRRNDVSLYVYDTTDGIWIRPHTIWGRFFLRRAGWDDSGRAPGSSYCAVTNGAALAFGDTSGANGSIPSGYFELFPFDGSGGSHTGGRYIENNTNSDG